MRILVMVGLLGSVLISGVQATASCKEEMGAEMPYSQLWEETLPVLHAVQSRLTEVNDPVVLRAAATLARGLHDSWWNNDHATAMAKIGKTKDEPKYKAIKKYTFGAREEAVQKISELEAMGYADYRISETKDGKFSIEQNYAKPSEKVDPELNMQMNGSLTTQYIKVIVNYLGSNRNLDSRLIGGGDKVHDAYVESARWEIDSNFGLMAAVEVFKSAFEKIHGHTDVYKLELGVLYDTITTIFRNHGGELQKLMTATQFDKFRQFQITGNLTEFEANQDNRTFLKGVIAIAEALKSQPH